MKKPVSPEPFKALLDEEARRMDEVLRLVEGLRRVPRPAGSKEDSVSDSKLMDSLET